MPFPNADPPQRSLARTYVLAGALVLAALATPGAGYALFVREGAWAPDGQVKAIASSSNMLYIGGSFSTVGPVSGPAVALDGTTFAAQEPYPRVVGKVRAVEPDGTGGWYIGGAFTSVQGQPRSNLAHIDAAGALTSWNPYVNGEIDDIALGAGVVYIAGTFSAVGDSSRSYVAGMDVASGLATSWHPILDAPATEIELGTQFIYIGGTFTSIDGTARNCLAAFEIGSGTLSNRFDESTTRTEMDAMEFFFGALFFAYTNAADHHLVLIYSESAGTYHPNSVDANGPIHDITFDGSTGIAYLGGTFTTVGGLPHFYLAAFQVASGAVTSPYAVDGPVRTVAHAPFFNVLVIGGGFGTVGGMPRKYLAVLSTTAPMVLDPTGCGGGEVYAVEFDGAKIYAGGDFSIINGIPRSNLAAIDATSGVPFDWSPATNGAVDALTLSGNALYVGGQFSMVNGATRNRAASVDALSGALTPFHPNVDVNFPTTVKAFAIDGSTVYMGGAFGTVGGVERIGLAAVNATTGALLPWNPDVNGSVYALSFVPGGIFGGAVLVVGGQFTLIGGQARNNLATVDAQTGASGALHNPNGYVHSLVVEPLPPGFGGFNDVYIGGTFNSVGGQPRDGIAQVAPLAVLEWAPNANGIVYAIAKVGNTVFVGGDFTSIGAQSTQPRNHIAAIDANTGVATAWDPSAVGGSPPGVVYALLKHAGTVYAGGTFTTIAGTPQAYFAGISDGTVTGVDEVERDPAPDVMPLALRVAPNPFEHSTMVQFSLVSGGKTRVAVFDVAGRRVRELQNGWLPSGSHTMPWDGRDGDGHPVAAGIYFLGVRTQADQLGSKVYRLK